jgi:hypothetical protein
LFFSALLSFFLSITILSWRIAGGEGMAANTANRRVLVTNKDGSQVVKTIEQELGIKRGDKEEMRRRLQGQGEKDIEGLDLYGSYEDVREGRKGAVRPSLGNGTGRGDRPQNRPGNPSNGGSRFQSKTIQLDVSFWLFCCFSLLIVLSFSLFHFFSLFSQDRFRSNQRLSATKLREDGYDDGYYSPRGGNGRAVTPRNQNYRDDEGHRLNGRSSNNHNRTAPSALVTAFDKHSAASKLAAAYRGRKARKFVAQEKRKVEATRRYEDEENEERNRPKPREITRPKGKSYIGF